MTKDGVSTIGLMSMEKFFGPVVADIYSHLYLSNAFKNKGLDQMGFYDARCLYDQYRKRFWIVSLVTNKSVVDKTKKASDREARRNRIACAVSKTSDPRDGFWMYWWDATPYDGQPGTDWKAGDAGDYPSVGISPRFFMQTNSVNWFNTSDLKGKDSRWNMITLVDADALADGRAQYGWMFHKLKDSNGATLLRNSTPAMQYGDFASDRAYMTKAWDAGGDPRILIFGWDAFHNFPRDPTLVSIKARAFGTPPDADQKASSDVPNPAKIELWNVNSYLLRTVARGNRLYTVLPEGVKWSGFDTATSSVRYFRMDLSKFSQGSIPTSGSVFIQRTFGKRNKFDPATQIFHYGMPTIEVNSEGNAVIGYIRSGKTIFSEARFTVHYGDEGDVRPSLQLRAGEGTYPDPDAEGAVGQLDCLGASLDPNGKDIWVAIPYAYRASTSSTQAAWRIVVGKVRP